MFEKTKIVSKTVGEITNLAIPKVITFGFKN